MKTKTLLTLSLAFFVGVAAQAAPLTVAVYDFKGDGNAADYGSKVTTLVTADLTTKTNLVLVERQELNKALNEQAFGISGLVSADAAAKIGQISGAKVLVAGQVIKTGQDHLVIVANIIGTETGRLFADKVEGAADNLTDLTSDLSRKITQTITAQSTNLLLPAIESHEERIDRIIKNIVGTNRPSVSIHIQRYGRKWNDATAEGELGAVLIKGGFTVVDANSDRKPDIEITGGDNIGSRNNKGNLVVSTAFIDVKIQERRTGTIIGFDRQESTGTAVGKPASETTALVNMADDLAERILPLLAK